ncbi:PP2C family protein-serine/threonine phosphatase [Streptomyces griseosporeus]|uniref:PP2C family protein-serine/threonine phosphatase n=1 Tax=Streptomyces griseosporeus TaxID=1910 RepID=UPI0036F91FA7
MAYVAVSSLSHPGLLRERNEDSLAVGPWTLCATVTENPQTLVFPLGEHPLTVAVADGLGGHPGGHLASALAVRSIAALGPALDGEDALREALQDCNRALYEAAGGDHDTDLTAMGTTIAGLVVRHDSVLIFNVGDSRVFAHSSDGLRQVSVDDSPPLHPGQRTTSMVTQCLGGSPGYRDVEPHIIAVPRTPGERYLLCSDGLTDPVAPEALDAILREHDDGRAAFELWRAAIEEGGPDNITVALVRIGDDDA